MVKQPSKFGRAVALSTCPADAFGEFTPPELVMVADEKDWENAKQRKAALLADPAFYKPPIVDEGEDYFAEIYNMPVLPYAGCFLGFPTVFNPLGAIPPPTTNFSREFHTTTVAILGQSTRNVCDLKVAAEVLCRHLPLGVSTVVIGP